MTGSWTSDEIEERFGRLAHELRIEVLRELWTAEDESLSFSELFDRVDERDSGKFSYHLDRLVPEFVRQADTGYVLTFAGRRTIGAIVSGSFTASNDLEIGS